MQPRRWRRIDQLFHTLVPCALSERHALLDRHCGDDRVLRAELETLLAAHERAPSFLEHPALDVSSLGPASDEAAIESGRRIGTYTIHGVLGRGGMGIVYEAEQQSPRRMVALKVMRSLPFLDDQTSRVFTREVRALARLEHPGIAAIYDAGSTPEGWHYFAMERIEGVSLVEHARDRGLALHGRLELFAQACDAVHYAHQRGVIHRDLKPSNILVAVDADSSARREVGIDATRGRRPSGRCVLGGRPKVLDFGLARITDPEARHTQATEHAAFQGTLAYCSPEQASGSSGDIDVRSDVYSLGVVLHELLADRLPIPIHGRPMAEAIRLVQQHEPPPLGRSMPSLRGDPETIVAKAITKDREARYQSVGDLARDIRRYLAGEPIEARRHSAAYVFRKLLLRHRARAAMLSLAAALAVACGWAVLQSRQTARSREELAREARISALRGARDGGAELERHDTAAAAAAAEIWQRIQQGVASEIELRELVEASVSLEITESSLYDISVHSIEGRGLVFAYATYVYGCPKGYGFLVEPRFMLDGRPLSGTGSVFRAETRRLSAGVLIPDLSLGSHAMSIGMNVTAARVARPGEARPFVPLAEAVGTRAMPFELFAVREHPADYPTAVPVTSYMETVAVDLRIDSACLAPQRPQPRQKTAPGDELRIVLSFPPPPLEMALDVNIRAADANLLISRSLALTPAAGSRPAELVYSDTLDEAGMDGDRFRVVLRIPATTVLISGNPESLVGSELVVECVSSRQVARYARFGRFLDVAASSRAMVGDDRPTARRAAGALVYPLLYKMLLPALVDQQLDSSALDERVRLAARELTRQAGSLDILRHQAWSVVASSDAGQLDYARALIRAEEAFRLAPDDPASQHIFGAALYRTGDYDAAVEVLERSLASSDEYEISKTAFLAMSEWRRGRLTAARDLLGRLGPASSMPLGARPNAREAEELVLGAPRPLADQSSLPGGS